MLLGNGGYIASAPFTILFVPIASGFLGLLIASLEFVFWAIRLMSRKRWAPSVLTTVDFEPTPSDRSSKSPDSPVLTLRNVAAWGAILLLVLFIIPHQVAFVITWLISIRECALARHVLPTQVVNRDTAISLVTSDKPELKPSDDRQGVTESRSFVHRVLANDSDSQNMYHTIILLQTLLIPLQAPVLAVWIRTIVTAGISTPFSGDHNVLAVCFWLLVVDRQVNGSLWRRSASRLVGANT